MSTGPETEVISCPACNHLLRVPADWLGVQVQCPECRAVFKALARDGRGGLTPAELISRPATPGTSRRATDPMLLLPAFGLMLVGFAGTVVDSVLAYRFLTDPPGAKEYVRDQIAKMRQYGVGAGDPEAERDRLDDERAAEWSAILRRLLPAFAGVSGLVFLGGVSMATRWNYRLAQLGCVAALLNLPNLCCIPGGVAGLWGLLMLGSAEGCAHFGR